MIWLLLNTQYLKGQNNCAIGIWVVATWGASWSFYLHSFNDWNILLLQTLWCGFVLVCFVSFLSIEENFTALQTIVFSHNIDFCGPTTVKTLGKTVLLGFRETILVFHTMKLFHPILLMEQKARSSYLGLSWDDEAKVTCVRLGYVNRRTTFEISEGSSAK